MTTKSLLEALSKVEAIFSAAGSTKTVAELKSLQEIFEGLESEPLDQTLDNLAALLGASPISNVELYAKQLKAAGADQFEFNKVYQKLLSDKRLKKADIESIANSYLHEVRKWATKKAALASILNKFSEGLYQESKTKIVRRYEVG